MAFSNECHLICLEERNEKMDMYAYTPSYLTKNGRPWFPVMGEIHYSRYPRKYWRESLYKMKAGGLDIVSCYAFWIHHEEIEGCFDFTGDRDVRAFLQMTGECGLKVLLRIGPWDHGEARNGGFPDWLLEKGCATRRDDPTYLFYVKRWYEELGKQVKGLFEKDGGPVIGIQLENEYGHAGGYGGEIGEAHMRTLKKLADEAGFDVPIRTATGWGGAVVGDCLPVMGGYCDAPWDNRTEEIEASGNFLFTPERNDHNIGSDHGLGYGLTFDWTAFPYLTAELGGGLQVTHHRRPVPTGKDAAAMSLCKMGSGCSLLGYYMYHGGTNPEGKLTSLQESLATGYPNDLPVRSYDFNAPIGEFGQFADSFREIRLLAMFLHDFGEEFCTMQSVFPKDNASSPEDLTALRYAFRQNDRSGYVFINNYVRRRRMADHEGLALCAEFPKETVMLPKLSVKDGDFLFLPVNFPLGKKAVLKAAAVTPLCCLNDSVYVFYGDRNPEYRTEGDLSGIRLVTLSRETALHAQKITLDRDYLFFCEQDLIPMEDGIHMQGFALEKEVHTVSFSTMPALSSVPEGFSSRTEGEWTVYTKEGFSFPEKTPVSSELLFKSDNIAFGRNCLTNSKEADPEEDPFFLPDSRTAGLTAGRRAEVSPENFFLAEAFRTDGMVYRLDLSKAKELKNSAEICDVFLELSFEGDRVEIFDRDTLLTDRFYTGQTISIGLKRYDNSDSLIVKIYALHENDRVYLEKKPVMEKGSVCRLLSAELVPEWNVTI